MLLSSTITGGLAMYVITGATGHTGSVAAETLLAAGKALRVVVRDAGKAKALAARGAELFTADLSDEAALTRAFEGADGVFVLSPPDATLHDFLGQRKKLTDGFARVAKAASVKHVVLLSSVGARCPVPRSDACRSQGSGPRDSDTRRSAHRRAQEKVERVPCSLTCVGSRPRKRACRLPCALPWRAPQRPVSRQRRSCRVTSFP